MVDAAAFIGTVVSLLWVALAVAIGVFVVAGLTKLLGPIVRRIEAWALPALARRTRVHHGLPPDAPRWACRACHSVNEPTAAACYRCGAAAPEAAQALPEAAAGELFASPLPPPNRFDPALYRGPGAPPPGAARPGEVGAEPIDAEPVDAEPVDAEPVDAEPVGPPASGSAR
jgi:hypothetical protein